MRQLLAVVLFILLLILSTVFVLNNDQILSINYLLGKTEMSVSTLVFWASLTGFLLGLLAISIALVKTRLQLKRTQSKLQKAQQEVNNLRTMPIKDTM